MMKTLTIRNLEIGTGLPKICVPIVGKNEEDIYAQAELAAQSPAQIAEWRCDYASEKILAAPESVLAGLRQILGDKLLLVTFRTKREGGEKELDPEDYRLLYERILASGQTDLLDVEWTTKEAERTEILRLAKKCGVFTLISLHFFDKTPSLPEMGMLLQQMEKTGASIVKLAVMPQDRPDVLRLMTAAQEFSEVFETPLVAISMGKLGLMSRLAGELTGSCITFGTAGQASAPGQIDACRLAEILHLLHM